MGEKFNILLKPIEQSAIYRRRIVEEKGKPDIEDTEEIELNYMLSSLLENKSSNLLETNSSVRKAEREKLTLRFPLSDELNHSEKYHIKDDFHR